MIKEIHKLLDEADAVITYNGDRFDLKVLMQEFMELGLKPPSPYKSIDVLRTMKRKFYGTSNKMDYWLKKLSLGAKVQHRGLQLWIDCMAGDKDAFDEMIEYNIGDVEELEKLYKRVLPYIPGHPNLSVSSGKEVCPQCGFTHFQKRGTTVLATGTYQRYQCSNAECGKWFRGTVRLAVAPKSRFINL